MFRKLLRQIRSGDRPFALYAEIVAQARQPAFYQSIGVADTVDGRFDMIVLHVVLVMRRLRREGSDGRALSQSLFDLFFTDMDRSLREIGVGDMAVPKRIRAMAEAFYGRAGVYDAALDAGPAEGLGAALQKNVFGGTASQSGLAQMAAYVVACENRLAGLTAAQLFGADIDWPDAPEVADADGPEIVQ